jgi:hypothetical protein
VEVEEEAATAGKERRGLRICEDGDQRRSLGSGGR